jgi:hypothetical protein
MPQDFLCPQRGQPMLMPVDMRECLDGTKLAGSAAQKANRTLPQIGKILAEAAAADASDDAAEGDNPQPAAPRALARRAERREPPGACSGVSASPAISPRSSPMLSTA